jgi:hypothetical protein
LQINLEFSQATESLFRPHTRNTHAPTLCVLDSLADMSGCCQRFELESAYWQVGTTFVFDRQVSSLYNGGNVWTSSTILNTQETMIVYESDPSFPNSVRSYSLNANGGSYDGCVEHTCGSISFAKSASGSTEYMCPEDLTFQAWASNWDGNGNNWATLSLTCGQCYYILMLSN